MQFLEGPLAAVGLGPDDGWWALALAIAFLVVLFLLFRALSKRGPRIGGRKGAQSRLAVTDAAVVTESRGGEGRRLVLVRRDDVEHLLMIGGPTDIVVERNIGGRRAERSDDRHSASRAAPPEPVALPEPVAPPPPAPEPPRPTPVPVAAAVAAAPALAAAALAKSDPSPERSSEPTPEPGPEIEPEPEPKAEPVAAPAPAPETPRVPSPTPPRSEPSAADVSTPRVTPTQAGEGPLILPSSDDPSPEPEIREPRAPAPVVPPEAPAPAPTPNASVPPPSPPPAPTRPDIVPAVTGLAAGGVGMLRTVSAVGETSGSPQDVPPVGRPLPTSPSAPPSEPKPELTDEEKDRASLRAEMDELLRNMQSDRTDPSTNR